MPIKITKSELDELFKKHNPLEKMYKAMVTEKRTGEKTFIESSYHTKQAFIEDLRANGYAVDPSRVKEKAEFNRITDGTEGDDLEWKPRKNKEILKFIHGK